MGIVDQIIAEQLKLLNEGKMAILNRDNLKELDDKTKDNINNKDKK